MNSELKMTKLQFSIMLVLVLFISVTGFTYAYFALSISNNNTIMGTAATVNLTLGVEKVFPLSSSSNTGVLVPQLSVSESASSPLSVALKNGCIDDNDNVVCQVYEITIENVGGTATQIVDGFVSFYSNVNLTTDVSTVMPNLRWKLITSIDTATPNNSVLGGNADLVANFNKNVFADDLTLATGDGETYYMIIWINETNEEQPLDEGQTFYGQIEFSSSNGTGVSSTFTA